MLIVALLFICVVASLIWGRLFFFKVNTGTPFWLALGYDLVVVGHILLTAYYMITVTQFTQFGVWIAGFLYGLSLVLFWWSIRVAKRLDFAFSNQVGDIVTTGPFAVVRHPFYSSYMLAWVAGSFLFNSSILWITLFLLGSFYFISARREESVIMSSPQSEQYKNYKQNVGMFLPRIRKWKQSHIEH